MADSENPEHAQHILELTYGFIKTQILLASDELGLFELLREGPMSIAEIASTLKAPESSLERLLIGCASLNLLDRTGSRFQLTDISRTHLLKGKSQYLGGMFGIVRQFHYPLYQHLAEAIREDQSQWAKVPGMKAGLYPSAYQDEDRTRSLMDGMFSLTYGSTREATKRFDFSRFHHIVDLGGAPGAFLAAVCEANPDVRGTILDLPPVAHIVRETLARFKLTDRVRFVTGDFFKDPLPPADLYALGFILHNWSRDTGAALLRKIYEALPDHGAVFLSEALFNPTKSGPFRTARYNLTMLLATGEGEERTPQEYEEWLKEAGFSKVEYQYCDTPKSFIVGWKSS